MSTERFLTKVFNKAAEYPLFRGFVRNAGTLVFGSYASADTTLMITGAMQPGGMSAMQIASGGLFLTVDCMFLLLDRYPKIRLPMSMVYLAAAAAFGAAGLEHEGWRWQMLSAAIIGGKALGHLSQSFNTNAAPEGAEQATEAKKGLLAKYPVVSTVAVDFVGKSLFAIGAVVGGRVDLMVVSALDFLGTISSFGTDKSLKQIVAEKDAQVRAENEARSLPPPSAPAV